MIPQTSNMVFPLTLNPMTNQVSFFNDMKKIKLSGHNMTEIYLITDDDSAVIKSSSTKIMTPE